MDSLLRLFSHFFADAKLEEDFIVFQQQESGSIEELIYRACGVSAEMISTPVLQSEVDANICLNQMAIINIIRSLYGLPAQGEKPRVATAKGKSRAMAKVPMESEDYASYYKRVMDLGTVKNWK